MCATAMRESLHWSQPAQQTHIRKTEGSVRHSVKGGASRFQATQVLWRPDRIIIEQSIEWNRSLCQLYRFEEAFDSADRHIFSNILRHRSIPDKLINIMAVQGSARVIHGSGLSEFR